MINKGASILQPNESFDSDDSNNYFDPIDEYVINELDEKIKEEKQRRKSVLHPPEIKV